MTLLMIRLLDEQILHFDVYIGQIFSVTALEYNLFSVIEKPRYQDHC